MHRLAAPDAIREVLRQVAPLQGRGEQDACVALAIIQVHRHDELLPRQPLGPREHRAAAVGENEAAHPARSLAADAVRVGERQQQARVTTRVGAAGAGGAAGVVRLPFEIARDAPGPLQRRPVKPRRAVLCAHELEARADIRIARPRTCVQQIAFRQQCRELRGERQLSEHARTQQHVRQARMHDETRQLAPVRGNASGAVQCPETGEQIPRAAQLCGRRRIEPAQRLGIPCAPARQLQRQRREIGVQDLRRRERCQSRLGALAPCPVADTRCQAPGTTLALIRGSA